MTGRRGVRAGRRVLVLTGVAVTGYAVTGALGDPDVRPVAQLGFLAGVLIAHDAVVLPVVIGLGALAARWLPAWARAPVQAAGFATACLALVALPLVGGFGRRPDEPSALPGDYGRGLLLLLAAVWAVAAVAAARRRRHGRRAAVSSRRAGT